MIRIILFNVVVIISNILTIQYDSLIENKQRAYRNILDCVQYTYRLVCRVNFICSMSLI